MTSSTSYTLNLDNSNEVINKTNAHSLSYEEIRLSYLGDGDGGICTYLVVNDATLILALCPINCLSGSSGNTCDQCTSDMINGLYYWDNNFKICTTVCSTNYYSNLSTLVTGLQR